MMAYKQFDDNDIGRLCAYEGQVNGGRSSLGPERLSSLQRRHQKAFNKRQTPKYTRSIAQGSFQESKACAQKMLS